MPTVSEWTAGNVTLSDPVPLTPSSWTTGSVELFDPVGFLPSSWTTGSKTLTVVEPTAGPRYWSHSTQVWIPVQFRYHMPGIAWE